MTDTKIQGKFYPLQHEEWLRACRELTPAQRDVLYYLRTLDPYSSGLEVSPAKIAKDLSTPDKLVHRSTVGRALKVLDEKGFIDMELLKVKVNILTKGLHCCDEATSCDEATLLPTDNLGDHDATSAIATQQARSLRNKHEPEPSPDKDSTNPKIYKNYLDFIDSLSEEEREEFLKFGENKAAQLPHPPTLPRRWVEINVQELSAQWYKSKGQSSPAQNSKWENDPRTRDWLAIIEETANPLEFAAGNAEKIEFVRWAKETKQFSWLRDNHD
ncbi:MULTISPECIES: MarR family transcriptional regulator [Nostocaceae]|uniref:MarR family transcriptional regulator n=1 Tax=Nostocaceae TaxID=1162 RepID=UPI001F54F8C1|nr:MULTISPECIES: MarR family transcriptional regulator [Nostocaceae]